MSPYSQNEYFYYFLILLAAGFLCFINLGGHPIYILDEAKNAEAAREMFVNQNWVVPTFNGELRTDKPPLHYWFMMISYHLFGVSSFSARFFSAFFGVLTIISSYHFTKKFGSKKLAALTAFVLCSALFFMQEFHLAVPDPYLIFFVSFALFNFYGFYLQPKKSNWLSFYIAIGLGILAKGPVAAVLPAIIILLFLWMKKDLNWEFLKRFNPLLGGFLSLAIALPWFVVVHQATDGAYTQGFFLEHNVQRFSSEMEGHGGLPFVTWAFVLLGLLPFSFFIVQGFVRSWKNRKNNDFILFSFLVSSVFVVFFSISFTKLPNYPMPAYPFIALLIAFYLKEVLEGKVSMKGFKISLWTLFFVSLLLPIGAYIALTMVEKQLAPAHFNSFYLAILPIGILIAIFYLKKGKLINSLLAIGFSAMFLSLQMFQLVYPNLLKHSPIVLAKEVMSTDTKTILYKGYDPAFLFNFERTFPLAENTEQVIEFINENPDGLIITKEKFYKSDWEGHPTEVLLKQKAIFENYTLVIFKLK